MTHAHLTTWIVAFILFFVALSLQKNGKDKVVHMILRLFYLLIIATGVGMLFSISNIDIMYVLKALVGLWIISMWEMILIRNKKGKRTTILWVQLIVAFLLVLYLGLSLPLGFKPFM
ncbi:YisL family protein [Cytobacillus sp. OWB-43]|uniref:YisL family protein n=1 Tax=unclassified Cytobacillus TaxID=2675268 RepID=UPI002B00000F|nr:YisL family protein [Cytobacillus sp. OWB-43]MEA1851615.1 YisL family protein [Cytobacillus sp. OWB-43]